MNLHPIFVHFPIAFLTLYGILELVRWKKITGQPYWFYMKAVLAIAGSLGTLAAYETGKLIAYQFRAERNIVSLHSSWANITIIIFGVIAVAYLIAWVRRAVPQDAPVLSRMGTVWTLLVRLQSFVLETPLVFLLAIAGLVAVTVTGALGGALAYGPDVDPIVKLVYRLLVK